MLYIILGAIVVGLTLGLIGSGGSILTVPVLTYLLGHPSKVAIAESLAIVGGIALVGVFPYARARQVDWRSVAFFGLPGMAGTFWGAWLSEWVSGTLQLLLFAVVMLAAAATMLRKPKLPNSADPASPPAERHALWKIAGEGLLVGIVTGLVGVGGGFLIVPALVVLGGLPIHMAIGTSLAIIALKSLSGLAKYLEVLESAETSVDWPTVAAFMAVGVIASIAGKHVASRLDQGVLRRVFALFLVAMGIFVLGKETPQAVRQLRGRTVSTATFQQPLAVQPLVGKGSEDEYSLQQNALARGLDRAVVHPTQ